MAVARRGPRIIAEEDTSINQGGTLTPDVPAGISHIPLLELHYRILRGVPDAVEQLAGKILRKLHRDLRLSFRSAPDDILMDAVEDAVLEYIARPHRFDATRGIPLDRFLYKAAWRNAVNLLQAEAKRKNREAKYASALEHQKGGLNVDARPNTPWGWRDILSYARNEDERRALVLWLRGERRTTVLAAALGCAQLPAEEQRADVKRFRERFVKWLRRRVPRTRILRSA
jgi:hypothetical protein